MSGAFGAGAEGEVPPIVFGPESKQRALRRVRSRARCFHVYCEQHPVELNVDAEKDKEPD